MKKTQKHPKEGEAKQNTFIDLIRSSKKQDPALSRIAKAPKPQEKKTK